MIKEMKRRGFILEDESRNGEKWFKWNGKMAPTGARTGAANKASNILKKPKFCPFTGLSDAGQTPYVMDHKDGRIVMEENDYDPEKITKENVNDYFMWINRSANSMKREACKRCVKTNEKDPARVGSMAIPQGEYKGTCKGCYWSDPRAWFISRGIHNET